jgi:hypothetical protein
MATTDQTHDEHAECAYCGATVTDGTVPAPGDDAEWERLATEHRSWCEWISTRAHTRAAEASGG